MKYSIVYSSKTGNTALLAERLHTTLPAGDCVYCGAPVENPPKAELVFVGFWTDKGSCDETVSAFLASLRNQNVFLFGTAGFGGSESYFAQILARVQAYLDGSNTVIGSYMCQGKMPMSVRQRYASMLPQQPEKMQGMLDNFDSALSHPDTEDLAKLEQAAAGLAR